MSSSLSWLGSDNSFSIVGYSLGGPISLAFAGAFPESVRSLVLFGPAGLLHRLPEGYDNPVLLHRELAPSEEAIRETVRQILDSAERGAFSRGAELRYDSNLPVAV